MSRSYEDDLLSANLSFKSCISVINLTWGGAPNCVLTSPAKIASMTGCIIRWVEWTEKLIVMIWLCGLMRYCQYNYQLVFANFAIDSLWVSSLYFHLLCKLFRSGNSFILLYFTRLVEKKVWFTTFTMFFDTLTILSTITLACLILASQSTKRMSLCVSSILGGLAFLPSFVSCHSMNYEILVFISLN